MSSCPACTAISIFGRDRGKTHTCTSLVASTGVPATPTTFALCSKHSAAPVVSAPVASTPVAATPVVSTPVVSTPVASTLVPTATAFVPPVQPIPSVSGQIDKECYDFFDDDSDDELSELRGQVNALQLQNGDLINKVDRLEVMLAHVIKLLEPKNIPKNNRSKKPSAPTASAPTASSPAAVPVGASAPTAATPAVVYPCRCAAKGGCSGNVKQIHPKPKGSVDPNRPIDHVTNPAAPPAPSFGICEGHDKHKNH
jgi:hypothetical protein